MTLLNGLLSLGGFAIKRAYQLIQIRVERYYFKSKLYRFISEDK